MGKLRSATLGAPSAARARSFVGVVALAALGALAPGCQEFDTDRGTPKRASIGEEMYGVLCDRLAAQALREDLSGDSFRAVCHAPYGGAFADTVDESKLPPLRSGAVNEDGQRVSMEKQRADRDRAIGRVEAFARRRGDLIRALDATFPGDEKIGIKDLRNPDPARSCDAPKGSGEGLLADELADMLGRMGDLYNDGTLPHSTRSLARVVRVFEEDEEAQKAWSRVSARRGYRPIDTSLGALRPVVAYPHLRDFANASLRLLSADSDPYEENPRRDADGSRVPVPGPGNAALNKLLEVSHAELLAAKVDPKPPALQSTTDASGRVVISRPRETLEVVEHLLYQDDDAFKIGSRPRFIVRRDARGYAKITGGAVPAPFVDADEDGLPDVDEVGRFKTSNGSVAPSPFPYPGAPPGTRDAHGRAMAGSVPLYEYIDTSRTFAAQLTKDMRALVSSSPEAKREALMDLAGGLPVVMGPREPRTKRYGDEVIAFEGVRTEDSPLLDLVHAFGAILGDGSTDATLAMTRELFVSKPKHVARAAAAISAASDTAAQHPEASIPRQSIFWDEMLDTMAKMAKEPGLLEDLLRAFATPETQQLGVVFSRFANFKDEVDYDRRDINGAPYNLTTKSKGEMKTPVDRGAPITGKNRSALHRFLQLITDTMGVTACNKPDAKMHAFGVSLPPRFDECEIFKIENLAAFYIDAIAHAAQYDAGELKRGAIYMRPGALRIANITDTLEDSSGITGFWPSAGSVVAPTPNYLNRLVFFDVKGDTQNPKTKLFVADLQGEHIGASVCPERVIDDPVPGAKDSSFDGKVRGLRTCAPGQWLQERNPNTIFTLEHFGFYDAIRPIVGAFVKHRREDLFLEMAAALYKAFPGADASPSECLLPGGKPCPRDGMHTYEPLLVETFASDLIPAIGELTKALDVLAVKTCTEVDARGRCTPAGVTTKSGIEIAAAATRAALDPDHAKKTNLTDRHGRTTTTRNDGTKVAQVTPAYLLTNALGAIDLAFDRYEEQNPDDLERRAGWRRARSQLVDQFFAVSGVSSNSTFANPAIATMTPTIIDTLRAQLWAHCPRSFVPPYERCDWARDELAKKAEESLAGPLVTAGVDVVDALRRDPEGRREAQRLLEHLLDPASKNDALASVLASMVDVPQALRDEENLVPLFRVLAAAASASTYDARGKIVDKSLVDAQMALLARVSGKYYDRSGAEICSREIDPNQVLAKVLAKLVTPIHDGEFKGDTPLEVLVDVIADVNREDPTAPYEGTLKQTDYASVSANVIDFLVDPERGLEQFYEVIRNGTRH